MKQHVFKPTDRWLKGNLKVDLFFFRIRFGWLLGLREVIALSSNGNQPECLMLGCLLVVLHSMVSVLLL